MKELKRIDIVLENCEVIAIERKFIGRLSVDDVKTHISRIACNSISKMQYCQHFSIQINRNLKEEENNKSFTFETFGEKGNPFDRLHKHPDIAAIDIIYEDDTNDYIYVDWCEENEWSNKYQTSFLNPFGDLYILVSKTKEFSDFYNLEAENDQDYVNLTWKMCEEIDYPKKKTNPRKNKRNYRKLMAKRHQRKR